MFHIGHGLGFQELFVISASKANEGRRMGQGRVTGRAEDEIVGWHYQHNEHEFEQTPGDSKRQGSLASCSSWGCKELVLT